MMVQTLLNHIQGKNGSRWAEFIRNTGGENILIVAVDAAKYTNKGTICTFYGDVLVKPFEFDASETGFEKLNHLIQGEKAKHKMKEIVFGIETTGHYYEDLVRRSFKEGYMIRVINAATTAQVREMLLNRSKTDKLDLMAIVQAIMHGYGTSNELMPDTINNLQKLTRARRELVEERSSTQNRIRAHADHIFREFQGKSIWKNGKREHKKPFSDLFGKSSVYFMRHCLHPSDILELGEKGLRALSVRENLKLRDSTIQCLLEFANHSISQPKEDVHADQFLLNQRLDQLELLNKQIKKLEREIEDLFVQTEGAVILSVPGIGIVTGAELYAEMGNTSDFDHAGQLIKMAGTNPIVKQSGDRRPSYYAVSKQGRKPFRNVVFQVGRSLARNNPEMKQKYKALIERGKVAPQAYIALGNRMIRLAFSMIKYQSLYHTDNEGYTLLNQISKKLYSANRKLFFERLTATIDGQSA